MESDDKRQTTDDRLQIARGGRLRAIRKLVDSSNGKMVKIVEAVEIA